MLTARLRRDSGDRDSTRIHQHAPQRRRSRALFSASDVKASDRWAHGVRAGSSGICKNTEKRSSAWLHGHAVKRQTATGSGAAERPKPGIAPPVV